MLFGNGISPLLQIDFGNVPVARGDTAALIFYRKSLHIFESLAAADPDNALWQHDVARTYGRIRDMLSREHDFMSALDAYRKASSGLAGIVAVDPDNAIWEYDLATSYGKSGMAYSAANNLERRLFPIVKPLQS